jgi:hypothetical protein
VSRKKRTTGSSRSASDRSSRPPRTSSRGKAGASRPSRSSSRQRPEAAPRKPAPGRPAKRRRFDWAFIDMFIVALVLVIALMIAGLFWLALTGGM